MLAGTACGGLALAIALVLGGEAVSIVALAMLVLSLGPFVPLALRAADTIG